MTRIIVHIIIFIIMICSCSSYVNNANELNDYERIYSTVLQQHFAKHMPATTATIHIYLSIEGEDPSDELMKYINYLAPSIKKRSKLKRVGVNDLLLFQEYSADNKYFTLSIEIYEWRSDHEVTVNCKTAYCCDSDARIEYPSSIYYELQGIGQNWIIEDSWMPRYWKNQ